MGKLFYKIMVAVVLTVAMSGVAVVEHSDFTHQLIFLDTPLQLRETTSNTGNVAGVSIQQRGTGDASLAFLLPGSEWLVGIDNSEGDTFNISNATGSGQYTSTGVAITTSGNVGIGTQDPLYKLQIDGGDNLNLDLGRPSGLPGGGLAIVSRNDLNTGLKGLEFEASVYLFRGGNVGIGTENPPLYKLQIDGGDNLNLDLGRPSGLPGGGLAIVSRNDANNGLKGLEFEASVYLFRGGNISVDGVIYAGMIDATDVYVDVDSDGTIDTSVGELLNRVVVLEGLVSGTGSITARVAAIESALRQPGASGVAKYPKE